MEQYQKSISYLDYLENGNKIRNAGFAKTEEINGCMRMEVQMKNLPETYNGQYELCADNGGIVGWISLNRGKGSCCLVWDRSDHANTETKRLWVRLAEQQLVQTVWPEALKVKLLQMPEEEKLTEELPEEAVAMEEIAMEADSETVQEVMQEPIPETVQVTVPEIVQETAAETVPDEKTKFREGDLPREQYYGDKWEQLLHRYPVIHPFEDEREYLSVTPDEFVVLRREYHKMVHNSFLLHGYYNYHHLLLGRIQEKGEWHYYLGVPGNFYTREKMVAEMFGFEAFEGEKTPASPGDFGYYMKRVDI